MKTAWLSHKINRWWRVLLTTS